MDFGIGTLRLDHQLWYGTALDIGATQRNFLGNLAAWRLGLGYNITTTETQLGTAQLCRTATERRSSTTGVLAFGNLMTLTCYGTSIGAWIFWGMIDYGYLLSLLGLGKSSRLLFYQLTSPSLQRAVLVNLPIQLYFSHDFRPSP